MTRPLLAFWLGTRPYDEMYQLQLQLHQHVRNSDYDLLLLLEHERCITLGRGAHQENLLASRDALEKLGVAVHQTDRGGDVTLHAPGQLIAYPIVNLNHGRKDVRRYVNTLTDTMGNLVAPFGISTGTIPKMIGLWTDAACLSSWPGAEAARAPHKLGAIGVRISRWVTMHGFALNLVTDMSLFRLIVPCGISDLPVASVQSLTQNTPSPRSLAARAHEDLSSRLGLELGEMLDYDSTLDPRALIQLADKSVILP